MLLWTGAALAVAEVQKCCGGQEMFRACDLGPCDTSVCQDCEWSPWSDWGPGSCEGLCERHRMIKTPSSKCGSPCQGVTIDTKRCTPICSEDPVDCQMTPWEEWSECDAECGGGQQYRQRSVMQEASHNGTLCDGNLKETRMCGGGNCFEQVDCVVSQWNEWSACSVTCDSGTHERKRTVEVPSAHGGKPCNTTLAEIGACQEVDCNVKVNCLWGEWGGWSACSQSCGGGDRSRSRLITRAPRNGGTLCDPKAMSEVNACNTGGCRETQDCSFEQWSSWDACSCTCNGIQHRVRHIGVLSEQGGVPCSGNLREIRSCNTGKEACSAIGEMSVDCEFDEWAPWLGCTATCGSGQRQRHRVVLTREQHQGMPCTGVTQLVGPCEDLPKCVVESDNEDQLPVDCKWSEWDDWGACSASCNGGEKVRQRQVQTMPNGKGAQCADQSSMEVTKCNMEACGCRDCEWGAWADWGACTCTGLRERHRNMITHDHECGQPCIGAKVQSSGCQPDCAEPSVNCEFYPWGEWGPCTRTCGGGESQRERSIKTGAFHGGSACAGDLKEIRPCRAEDCSGSADCVLDSWSVWSACTASCGGGQQFRARAILTPESHGGKACAAMLSEAQSCGGEPCDEAKDCQWGDWSDYSACSARCGGGTMTRDRFIKVAPRGGGKLCAALPKSEMVECNTHSCESACVDATWTSWCEWSMCSVTCGEGLGWRHRTRSTEQPANHCGKGLEGDRQEFQSCGDSCAAGTVDCEFSEWSEFGDCSCSCSGVRDRTRRIKTFSENGGNNCAGPLKEIEACNVGICHAKPVDCTLSEWAPWAKCSLPCGGGQHTRTRTIVTEAVGGGANCDPIVRQIEGCNLHDCTHNVDCVWGAWEKWGSCSRDCGTGEKIRYRKIDTYPKHAGQRCEAGDTMQVTECNDHVCGKDYFCGFGEWASWSQCSTTCGPGEQIRRRELELSPTKMKDMMSVDHLNEVVALAFEDLTHEQIGAVFAAGVLFSATIFFQISRSSGGNNRVDVEQALLEQ